MTPESRSRVMRAITKKNTQPELLVRRALHSMGLRFRLHVKHLPGTPDVGPPPAQLGVPAAGMLMPEIAVDEDCENIPTGSIHRSWLLSWA
jgi:DNA mismatch endonuclease Vsr